MVERRCDLKLTGLLAVLGMVLVLDLTMGARVRSEAATEQSLYSLTAVHVPRTPEDS